MYRFAFLLLLFPSLVQAARPNLLLITIDTLRADHLGSYGFRAAQTPNLDALARKSLFFENAVCQDPLTLPSHASLFTGRYPYRHKTQDNAGALASKEITMAEILKKHGYHTYAFVGGFPLDHRFGLNQGFDVYNDVFPRQKNRSLDFRSERSAKEVVNAVLSQKMQEPFFLWIHLYDPHAPYLNGGYDGEIAFVDQQIGIVLSKLEMDNTVMAVAGDHGESLGDHGEYTHRIFVYDSTMHVPFWILGPGISLQRIKAQVRLIDFMPTILSILNLSVPSDLDGVVLPKGAGATAYVESLFGQLQLGWSPLRGIRTDRWKFIEAPRPELYELQMDPKEQQNIYSKHPKIVQDLRKQIPQHLSIEASPAISAETAEKLASLGYVSGATRGPESKIDPKDRIAVWNQIELAVDLEKSKPAESILVLEKARKMDPGNPMVLGFLAQKYAETNRLADAATILKDVLKRDPQNTLTIFRLATISLKAGKTEEALQWSKLFYKLEPTNPDASILLARAHMQLGHMDETAKSLNNALMIDPLDTELRIDLANVYLQQNKKEQSRQEFSRVLKTDSRNLQAINGLATCAFEEGDLQKAGQYLEQARNIDPADTQTIMNLALLYSNQGKTQEAIRLYNQVASSVDAPADWKQEAQRRLKELQ